MMCASDQYSSTVFLKRSNLDGCAPDTRISSPLTAPRLCVTIGRYWYLSKRLTAVLARRFYRFEYIVYSSFKAHSKQPISRPACFFFGMEGVCSAQVQVQNKHSRERKAEA